MFARGLVSLFSPPLLGRNTFSAKPCVSITYKVIEKTRLQVLYFGHLRKTGGRGSYRLVHTAYMPVRKIHGTKSNHSRTYGIAGGGGYTGFFVRPIRRASKAFVSPTYAKTEGCRPVENVGAPTFLIFPLIFRSFCLSRAKNITEERKRRTGIKASATLGNRTRRRRRRRLGLRLGRGRGRGGVRGLGGTRRGASGRSR
jgi:hypothetical protein